MIYKNIKIELPENVKYIINVLEKNNFEAYAVGGCVRDSLLNTKPLDYDITTNAKPDDIKKLFKKTVDTGIKHGTISILLKENDNLKTYEVTTYRIDGEYKDNRHPEEVSFVDNLKLDLQRRDFTINALAYNPKIGLVDEFDGLKDLNNKVIACVGDSIERFNEDALRMMRAIRFASQLDFQIDDLIFNAIDLLKENIKNVSKERIQVEIYKTLIGKKPEYIYLLFKTKISNYITKDFNLISYSIPFNTKNKYIAYASLLYNINNNEHNDSNIIIAKNILKELKLDNNTIFYTIKILEKKSYIDKLDEIELKKIINDIGYEAAYKMFDLYSIKEKKSFDTYINIIKNFQKDNVCISIKDLAIDGNDLINIGFSGKDIGEILNKLLFLVYKNNELNDKNILLKEVLKWKITK